MESCQPSSLILTDYFTQDQNSQIEIFTHKAYGHGDTSCGIKFANMLHQMGIPVKNIYISTNSDIDSAKKFNYENNFRIVDYETSKKIQNVVLRIVVPITDVVKYQNPKIPTILFWEYGYRKSIKKHEHPILRGYIETCSLGLNKKEVGILINQELKEYGFSERDSLERLKKILKASDSIQRAVFGVTKSNSPHEIGEKVKKFDEEYRLYICYSSELECQKIFAATICTICKDKTPVVFFVGTKSDIDLEHSVHQKWHDSLRNLGISY